MIKSRYFQDRTFATKEELFTELKANNDFIIGAKKSDIQKSCEKGISVTCKSLDLLKFQDQNKALKIDDNFYYIVVNTTNILDSHDDLHVKGIWKRTVVDQQGRNYLVADHELEIANVIVRKEHIEMFTAVIPFSVLGRSFEGNTEALIYKFPKSQVKNAVVKEWLESGDDIEASVRMQYVTILLALDSNNPEDATEKKNYDDYIGQIANKAEFDYIPYFYVIKEAKNIRESSLVVFASNSTTGRIKVAVDDTTEIKNEPSIDTQKEEQNKELLKQLLNKF